MTDPPVGIRPEINSHTPREKLFRVRLSLSLSPSRSFPSARQAFSYSRLLRAAPSLLLPASRRVSLTLPIYPRRTTNGTISARRTQPSAKETIPCNRIARSLLHRSLHRSCILACGTEPPRLRVPNTRSRCLDFDVRTANSERGKYEKGRDN